MPQVGFNDQSIGRPDKPDGDVQCVEGDAPSDLPDWDDLRGRAPDATGGLSSEVFVRELRDGWR